MSELETDSTEDANTESPWHSSPDRDWALARIVHITNRYGAETSITLTIGGCVISGTLISGTTYAVEMFDLASKATVSGPTGDQVKEKVLDVYRDIKAVFQNTLEAKGDFDIPPPAFIHLRDAHWLLSDGKTLYRDGRLWRGRLSKVDGFSMGS